MIVNNDELNKGRYEELLIVESLISHARAHLSDHGFDWHVCGGGAIDVFLNKKTRIHKDLDIAVFWEDRNSIRSEIYFVLRSMRIVVD
ncbi:MAG: nucleotidyltransferase domain-containing protein [Bacillota bacterium]